MYLKTLKIICYNMQEMIKFYKIMRYQKGRFV